MNYNSILFFTFIIGYSFILYELFKVHFNYNKDEKKIVYRYIPRTFKDKLNEPVSITKIFNTMFSQPSPWIHSIGTYNPKRQDAINKFFISQV